MHARYTSSASGENRVVDDQVRALREHGHEVDTLIHDNARPYRRSSALTAVDVATGRGRDIESRVREVRPDVIHLHNPFPTFSTRWLQRPDGPATVATLHNFRAICAAGTLFRGGMSCTLCPETGSSTHSLRYACYRDSRVATLPLAVASRDGGSHNNILRHSDALVALSDRAAAIWERRTDTRGRLHVIPNFTEAPPPQDGLSKAPRRHGWLYAGRLSPEKGVLSLVEQWPSHERLLVMGDGPERGAIARASAGKDIELTGHVPPSEVMTAMGYSEGLIFASLWPEGLPTVMLEALSAGLPILTTPENSVADVVEANGCGSVLDNWTALPDALSHARRNRNQLAEKARGAYANNYTRETWAIRMSELYANLTGAS